MPEMVKKNKEIFIICVVYGVILLAIFILVLNGNIPPSPDGYDKLAKFILSDGFFTDDGINANYSRTPGYPLLLTVIYFLGGSNTTVGIVQIFLTVINVYLFYSVLIIRHIPKRLSLFGSFMLLCYLHILANTFLIFTETLFGFLLMLSLYFLVKYMDDEKNMVFFLFFSIALNYALFVRPILMYFNMLVCLALLIAFVTRKIQFKCFVLFTLCFIIVFGGWSCRNYVHSGVFTFSTIQKTNMKRYYAPIITARIKKIEKPNIGGFIEGATDYHDELFLQKYPEVTYGNMNAAQVAILESKYGSRFIRNHFSEYIIANITGFLKMMLNPGFQGERTQSANQRPIVQYAIKGQVLFSLAYVIFIYLLYFVSLVIGFKKRDIIQIIIFLLCGYLAIPGAIFGNPRFRDPFFPLLLLSAVSNLGIIIQWLSRKLHIPVVERIEKYLLHESGAGQDV